MRRKKKRKKKKLRKGLVLQMKIKAAAKIMFKSGRKGKKKKSSAG